MNDLASMNNQYKVFALPLDISISALIHKDYTYCQYSYNLKVR